MCKATGNSHDAPVSQPVLNFVFNWKFHTILKMGPKLRARKADEPSEQLLEIRRRKAKLAKGCQEGKKLQQQRSKRNQNQTQEISLVNLHLHNQLNQVKNDKIYKLICTIIFFYLYKRYVKKPEKDKQCRK